MLARAFELIGEGTYDRIIYVRNNVQVKDTDCIGSLPGEVYDKVLPYLMPLADHVGGVDGLEQLVASHVVEAQPLGFIRGRDFKRSIIYCTEAENLTKEHIQLLLGRVGEGSALWLNGDNKQRDRNSFERSQGLEIMIERLRGNRLFGHVYMPQSERSEVSELANLLD